jgi:NAD(P)H dehydrogenase (quinone)
MAPDAARRRTGAVVIVVSAATGHLGRLVVDRLLDRVPSSEVAVAVRDVRKADAIRARGVEVRHGDYDDPASLRAAFAGADRLLFVSSPTLENRVAQHRGVVAAARDAGVGCLVYTSGLGADVVDQGILGDHHATEQAIRDSGLASTFLRNPIYTEMFVTPALTAAIEAGVLTSSTRGRGMNTASRADLAEAAAAVLAGPEQPRAAYDLTGRLWTYAELAALLGAVGGRPVVLREVDDDEGAMVLFGPVVRAGGFEVQTGDLHELLGRPPGSLADAVEAALAPTAEPAD